MIRAIVEKRGENNIPAHLAKLRDEGLAIIADIN